MSVPLDAALGLLAFGVLSFALTLNAHFPVRRIGSLALFSFFAGWLTCELALHHLIVQPLLAIGLVALGGFDGYPGWIGGGLLLLSWGGLVRLHQRAHLAGRVIARTLEQLEQLRGKPLGVIAPRWRDVLAPFSHRLPEARCEKKYVYAEVGGRRLKADIYYHRDRPKNAPVLVFVHGGGWVVGFKQYQALPLLNHLAAQGWVCMSVDYRLSPRATFPDHLIDVKRALAWAKEHAPEYGGNPEFIAVSGNSAGAHLASLAALTWDMPELQPGFEDVSTRVRACVPFYGVYDLLNRNKQWPNRGIQDLMRFVVIKDSVERARDRYELMSPISHVRQDAPPFFIVHGDKDTLVPVDEARHFSDALAAVSKNPVLYAEIPDAQHAFEIFRSIRGLWAVRAVCGFLGSVHEDHTADTSVDGAAARHDADGPAPAAAE